MVFGAVVLVAAVVGVSDPVARGAAKDVPAPDRFGPKGPQLGAELPELRTRTSRTYTADDGTFVTQAFSVPVNYRAADGSMQPVDLSLQSGVDDYRTKASGYDLSLPRRLEDEPVRVADGDDWVSFSLDDATGSAAVDGNVARYANALPGVDAVYTAGRAGLRKELVLNDAKAQRSFSFHLDAASGLTPKLAKSGSVSFEDAKGDERMALGGPFMHDADDTDTRGVDVSLAEAKEGWTLKYSLDDAWLDSPKRAWPVTVDPAVSPVPDQDCYIDDLPADVNSSFCAADEISVGYGGSPAQPNHVHRGLVRFDVQSAVPAGATILRARLNMWLKSQSRTTQKPITVHRVNRSWTNGATWNRYDGTNAWSTPGGEYNASPEVSDDKRAALVGGAGVPANTNYQWDVTTVAREWSSGQTPNNGLLLRDDPAAAQTDNELEFASGENADTAHLPSIELQYEKRVGAPRGQTLQRWQLNDRMELAVNPAGGNIMVTEHDLTVPGGIGPDMSVTRTFNGFGGPTLGSQYIGFGDRWTGNFGDGYRLRINDGGDLDGYLTMPDGFIAQYERNWQGGSPLDTFKTPTGFNNKLTRDPATGNYVLTENASQYKRTFDSAGRMIREEDRNTRPITYTWSTDGSRVTKVTDSKNQDTTVSYNANNQVYQVADAAGRLYKYDYDPTYPRIMRTYTDPSGNQTKFDYYGEGPRQITSPGNRVTQVEYYPAGHQWAGKVKYVLRKTASITDVDPKWDFFYDLQDRDGHGTTRVQDPLGNTTTYSFDKLGRITNVHNPVGDAKNTYTSNSNVQDYTTPGNIGGSASATYSHDSLDNPTGSSTVAGSGTLETASEYNISPNAATGGEYLPSLVQSEQDTGNSTAPNKRGIGITYDAAGRPKLYKATNSVTAELAIDYDTQAQAADGKPGRLHSITYPSVSATTGTPFATTYSYDTSDRLTGLSLGPPTSLLGSTALTYNAGTDAKLLRVSRVTDGKGQITDYLYDDLDRVKKATYKTSATGTTEATFDYVYDGDGNLTQRTDTIGAAAGQIYGYVYDDLGRVVTESRPGAVNTVYTYDNNSNLTSLQDAGGRVDYAYDSVNRMSAVYEPGLSTPIGIDYVDHTENDGDPDTLDGGSKTTWTFPNAVTTTNVLDQAGRLTKTESKTGGSTPAVLQRFRYDYLSATTKQVAIQSRVTDKDGATTDYGYDGLDRLQTALTKNSGGVQTKKYAYDYDAAGNILKRTVDSGTPTHFHYNEANELCYSIAQATAPPNTCGNFPAGATTYSYDQNGNELTASGRRSATYNARNQLASLTPTGLSASPRIYIGTGQAQRTGVGSDSEINDILGVASITTSSTPVYYTRGENGEVLSQRTPSATAPNRRHYFLNDSLGSVRGLTDETGGGTAPVRVYSYDPYGRDTSPNGSGPTSRFRYAGGELDPTAAGGLYHFGQRYYDPEIARWTQQDPLDQAADLQQANRYAYAGGDPTNDTDPTGLYKRNDGSGNPCVSRGNRYGCARGLGYQRVRRQHLSQCGVSAVGLGASVVGTVASAPSGVGFYAGVVGTTASAISVTQSC